jgi:hypothetical protein
MDVTTKFIRSRSQKDFKKLMKTATISLHRKNALIKFCELKNLVLIMKRMITLLHKVLVALSVVLSGPPKYNSNRHVDPIGGKMLF